MNGKKNFFLSNKIQKISGETFLQKCLDYTGLTTREEFSSHSTWIKREITLLKSDGLFLKPETLNG